MFRAALAVGIGVLLISLVFAIVGRGVPVSRGASVSPQASVAALSTFTLVPPKGIVFWMHPTAARVQISAASAGLLKACEVGTTFSYYWRDGCRRFVNGRLTLPSSGGAMHVGFRLLPASGRSLRVERLRVRWHCIDHFLLMQLPRSHVRLVRPAVFDC